jgi:CHAT domain-containing protein
LLTPATALAVTLAARRGDSDSIAKAWHLAMVERGLVARTQAHRLAAARAQSDPELAKAWDGWRHANSALGEAWMAKNVDADKMNALRADTERAERALWSHAGQYDAGNNQAVSALAELAHALPADGLLIGYTEGVGGDPAVLLTAGDKPIPEDWYAFAIGSDAKPQLRRIGNIQALSAQARAWYLDLRNPNSDPARFRSSGEQLRAALLDPLLTSGHAQHLFIVPDGELYRLSFAALPNRDRGYLIESGTRVHTLANESDLAIPASTNKASATLLAGAPMFASTKGDISASRQLCLRAARDGFAPIPNAGRELDDLDKLLTGAQSESASKPQITVVRGAEATKQNVLAALPQANIVHLATHGFSLDDSCAEQSGSRGVTLDRTPDSKSTGTAQDLVLSGLAFTGASLADGHEPVGVLSAGELATLDLSQVAWIALSACDSGLGPIGRNEGVFGMRRALRLAGARTVVMSLWQVDDAATADLMESLYRNRFVDHADVPDAMATAMLSVISARRQAGQSDHPYYWAAFIGEGGWR